MLSGKADEGESPIYMSFPSVPVTKQSCLKSEDENRGAAACYLEACLKMESMGLLFLEGLIQSLGPLDYTTCGL